MRQSSVFKLNKEGLMKTKKNGLLSLSIFIVIVSILSLFGQKGKPFEEIWDKLNNHDSRIIALEEAVTALQIQIADANSNISNLQTSFPAAEAFDFSWI